MFLRLAVIIAININTIMLHPNVTYNEPAIEQWNTISSERCAEFQLAVCCRELSYDSVVGLFFMLVVLHYNRGKYGLHDG